VVQWKEGGKGGKTGNKLAQGRLSKEWHGVRRKCFHLPWRSGGVKSVGRRGDGSENKWMQRKELRNLLIYENDRSWKMARWLRKEGGDMRN